MNPFHKLLWFLVLLAAAATAAAPVLDNVGRQLPVAGFQIVHFDELGCDAPCEAVSQRIDEAFPPDEWHPRLMRVSMPTEDAPSNYGRLPRLGTSPLPEGAILLKNYWDLGTWSMTDTDGRPFGSAELAGKIYIADFMFTNCAGPCPMMNDAMKTLVGRLPADAGIMFVSFSVDPEHDTPEVLKKFSADMEAPPRWKFLTGPPVYNLAEYKFKLGVRPTPGADPGNAVMHSTRFTLVDGSGRMRGTYRYDYDEPEKIPPMMDRLVRDARTLLETPEKVVDDFHDPRRFLVDASGDVRGAYAPSRVESLVRDTRRLTGATEPMTVRSLPKVNAILNGASFFFLSLGLGFILKRKIGLHKASMTVAFGVSLLFLTSYLTYHIQVGSVKYAGEGWMRAAYFPILISHTVLAAVVAPMAFVTVVRAWRERYDRHVVLARVTLPIWMYVSLTGILVYLMLYRLS
jgi:protein SCO1/2